MGITETRYEHIRLDQDGIAYIADTTMKVIELVLDQRAHGSSAEELHFQFPHLSLGQIHSALAYYWDHKEALDADMERRLENVDRLLAQSTVPPLVTRLRSME